MLCCTVLCAADVAARGAGVPHHSTGGGGLWAGGVDGAVLAPFRGGCCVAASGRPPGPCAGAVGRHWPRSGVVWAEEREAVDKRTQGTGWAGGGRKLRQNRKAIKHLRAGVGVMGGLGSGGAAQLVADMRPVPPPDLLGCDPRTSGERGPSCRARGGVLFDMDMPLVGHRRLNKTPGKTCYHQVEQFQLLCLWKRLGKTLSVMRQFGRPLPTSAGVAAHACRQV